MATKTDYAKLRAELDKVQSAMKGAKSEDCRRQLREVAKALNLAMARLPQRKVK